MSDASEALQVFFAVADADALAYAIDRAREALLMADLGSSPDPESRAGAVSELGLSLGYDYLLHGRRSSLAEALKLLVEACADPEVRRAATTFCDTSTFSRSPLSMH